MAQSAFGQAAYPRVDLRRVVVQGGYAYAADLAGDLLRVIDIRVPSYPALVGVHKTSAGPIEDVAIQSGFAYVPNGYLFDVVDVSDPRRPTLVPSTLGYQLSTRIGIASGYAYVTASHQGNFLYVLSLTDPAHPTQLGAEAAADTTPGVSRAALLDGFAYVGTPLSISIFDVRDPARPSRVGSYAVPRPTSGVPAVVAVAGTLAYVASGETFRILDLRDPVRPVELGSTMLPTGDPLVLQVSGRHAYLGAASGLQALDVGDPTRPALVGSYRPPGGVVYDAAVSGTLLYVAAGADGLRILNVNDPAHPREVAALVLSRLHAPFVAQRGGL